MIAIGISGTAYNRLVDVSYCGDTETDHHLRVMEALKNATGTKKGFGRTYRVVLDRDDWVQVAEVLDVSDMIPFVDREVRAEYAACGKAADRIRKVIAE